MVCLFSVDDNYVFLEKNDEKVVLKQYELYMTYKVAQDEDSRTLIVSKMDLR